ncbi:type II toxin-antitoxin system prevent-host-death family antitoxin [Streptomyces ardesiacus]|uniref:type II toxin-antitoxin system prevent-host-death family antitoxin n=1 Tax=Streptomyces ardesiacus TaxID=285564 RepID=UPI003651295C
MDARTTEHEASIAKVRNSFADAIGHARYSSEPTVLTSRGKRVAAIVPMEFYERALEALGIEVTPSQESTAADS